jgi:hypothetical protein
VNYIEMNKPALVDLAVEREVAKNKTAARKTDKAELIRLIEIDDIKRRGAAHAAAKAPEPAPAVPDATGEDIADSVAKVLAADKLVGPEPSPFKGLLGTTPDGRLAENPATGRIISGEAFKEVEQRNAEAEARAKPKPLALPASEPRKRTKLTAEQRKNKLRRNRRKHRARLAGRSARRGSGQGPRQPKHAA